MTYPLTELQLAILKVLWERGEAAVVDLHDALRAERRIAQTTVATLLTRMEKKGLVDRRTEGRQYLYRARVDESQVRRSVVSGFTELAGRLFEGDVAGMVSHLLTANEVERDDLARVREMIERREAELNGGGE
ncbi:MAG TPA: BlaI/MecI/CopY family transcriptional regulator [Longimicrobiaceae bacterium]|nr:BlaI/MecI/CopY family transcriptional regulator [Longimicrobiaceae bacterium]